MALDPSVIIPPPQQPINPLALYAQVQGVRNAQAQNLLLTTEGQRAQQQLGSDQAIGGAVQQSTDATTGDVDWGKVNRLVAGNPAAALGAQASANNSTGQQRQQTALSMERLESFQKHLGAVSDAIAPVLANPGATKADVVKAATGLVSNPDLDADTKSDLIKNTVSLVGSIPDGATTAQVHQRLQGLALQVAGNQAQIANLIGQNTNIDTGPNIVTGRQSPLGGFQPTAVIKKGLTPGEAAQPTPVVTPNAQGGFTEGTVPLGQRQALAGPNGVTPTSPGLTAQGMSLSEASQPQGVVNPTTGAQGFATKGQIAANPSAYSPGVAPGVAASLTTSGAQAADMATGLAKAAAGVPQRKAALDTALGELQNFQPGPKADFTKQIGALASEFGVASPGQVKGTAAQEEFGKLAVQIAQSQFQSLGGTGTDAKLESTMHTSPSEFLSKQGNTNIIALLKGNEDAIAAQNQAWTAWSKTHPPSTYPQFQAQWNRIYDPRVFQSQYMDAGQLKAMKSGMSPAELKAYSNAQALAERYGWVQ